MFVAKILVIYFITFRKRLFRSEPSGHCQDLITPGAFQAQSPQWKLFLLGIGASSPRTSLLPPVVLHSPSVYTGSLLSYKGSGVHLPPCQALSFESPPHTRMHTFAHIVCIDAEDWLRDIAAEVRPLASGVFFAWRALFHFQGQSVFCEALFFSLVIVCSAPFYTFPSSQPHHF